MAHRPLSPWDWADSPRRSPTLLAVTGFGWNHAADSLAYRSPWRRDNGRVAASPTRTFLVNAFRRPPGVGRGRSLAPLPLKSHHFVCVVVLVLHASKQDAPASVGPRCSGTAGPARLAGIRAEMSVQTCESGQGLRGAAARWDGPHCGCRSCSIMFGLGGCESTAVPNVFLPKRSSVGCSRRRARPLIRFIIPFSLPQASLFGLSMMCF